MRLPGTEPWDLRDINKIIEFERSIAKSIPNIIQIIKDGSERDPTAYLDESDISDAPFALMRAAELAFVTDQFSLGVNILKELLMSSHAKPQTTMQLLQWTIVGTALNFSRVRINEKGINIISLLNTAAILPREITIPWPSTAKDTCYIARQSIPAAILSGTAQEAVEPAILRSEGRGLAGAAFIELSDEYRAALSIDGNIETSESFGERTITQPSADTVRRIQGQLFRIIELSYTQKLTAMRRTPMWNNYRLRGNLIDWNLLLLWIARLERNPKSRPASPRLEEAIYIHKLAKKFVTLRKMQLPSSPYTRAR